MTSSSSPILEADEINSEDIQEAEEALGLSYLIKRQIEFCGAARNYFASKNDQLEELCRDLDRMKISQPPVQQVLQERYSCLDGSTAKQTAKVPTQVKEMRMRYLSLVSGGESIKRQEEALVAYENLLSDEYSQRKEAVAIREEVVRKRELELVTNTLKSLELARVTESEKLKFLGWRKQKEEELSRQEQELKAQKEELSRREQRLKAETQREADLQRQLDDALSKLRKLRMEKVSVQDENGTLASVGDATSLTAKMLDRLLQAERLFWASVGGGKSTEITKIEYVINRELHDRFKNTKKRLISLGKPCEELLVFHGTPSDLAWFDTLDVTKLVS
jgi:DNA repair exonuclease SbcCD ATPase subunit